jgi:hypothetical protein
MSEKKGVRYSSPPEKPAHETETTHAQLVFVLESPGEIEHEHEFSS